MSSFPLISIALATYNGERYLEQLLDSLVGQDYPNFEIVVSDDGSSDRTLLLLQHYAGRDQRIRLLPSSGHLGFNRNFARCFAACRGELISPCDQDDSWYTSKTRRLAEAIGDALLVYCNSRAVDEQGYPLGWTIADKGLMVEGSDPRRLLFFNSIASHAMMFRRRLLMDAGDLSRTKYHDWWLSFVAANLGAIVYVDEILVDYRVHDASVMQSHHVGDDGARRRELLDEDKRRLSLMAEFPGPHQAYVQNVWNAWHGWAVSYFDCRMFRLVMREGQITHFVAMKHKTRLQLARKYMVGHRLKQLIWPHRYGSARSGDDGV